MQSPIIIKSKPLSQVVPSSNGQTLPTATKSERVLEAVTQAVTQVMHMVDTGKQVYETVRPMLVPISLLVIAFIAVVVIIQAALFVGHMPLVPQLLQTGGFAWVVVKAVEFTKLNGRQGYVEQLTKLKEVSLGGN